MSIPHRVTKGATLFHDIWWLIRGVKGKYWRVLCVRCGETGQAHFAWNNCIRFKPSRKMEELREI